MSEFLEAPPSALIEGKIGSSIMKKQEKKWDAFISYAVEDQDSFVRNLAAMLTRLGHWDITVPIFDYSSDILPSWCTRIVLHS